MADRKISSIEFKDTKQASQPDHHKISAFQVAPTRKTAFEKSREEAQKKADREAAETAAAYEEFVAEYGPADEGHKKKQEENRRPVDVQRGRDTNATIDWRSDQRTDRPTQQVAPRTASGFEDVDSEEEERERRRVKLKSSSNFLDELKQNNKKRERYEDDDQYGNAMVGRNARSVKHFPPSDGKFGGPDPRVPIPSDAQTQPVSREVNESEDESGDDIDYYRTKISSMSASENLNTVHKARLKYLLDGITAKRSAVARVTAFAVTHASSVEDISTMICDSMSSRDQDWKLAVARLWCVSDILHNSWIPIPNAWKYRNAFEVRLTKVFERLKSLGETIESRIRKENFRRLVTSVLDVWSKWICFTDGTVDKLCEAFEDSGSVAEESVPEVKQEKKTAGWKKVDSSSTVMLDMADKPLHNGARELQKDESDGEEVNLDGEKIDLDGEEIDLDGDAIDLDGDEIDLDGPTRGSDPRDTRDPHSTEQDTAETRPEDVSPVRNVASAPKIKMTFGKINVPLKPRPIPHESFSSPNLSKPQGAMSAPDVQPPTKMASSTPEDQERNDLREYERLVRESTDIGTGLLKHAPKDDVMTPSDQPLGENVATVTSRSYALSTTARAGKPFRRSAADFMD